MMFMNKQYLKIALIILSLYLINNMLGAGFSLTMNMIKEKLIFISLVILALMFHEVAHGYVAYKLGDPTPLKEKRLNLNPLNHIDPVGFLMFVFVGIGWAKPVRINPFYFENPKKAQTYIAAAGPASNFILAALSLWFLKFFMSNGEIKEIILLFSYINILLGIFNLVPILPLDGGRILYGILPRAMAEKYADIEPFGFIIVILLIWFLNFGVVIQGLSIKTLNIMGALIL